MTHASPAVVQESHEGTSEHCATGRHPPLKQPPAIAGREPAEQAGGASVHATFFGLQLRANTQRPAMHVTSAAVMPREVHWPVPQAMLHVAPWLVFGTD